MRGSQALTMPGTHTTAASNQQQQQQPPTAADSATPPATAAAAGSSLSPTSEGGVQGSGLGHARVQGWGSGWGSSAASRYWAGQGLPEVSRKDDKDATCAKW
jgi:hypothetical protein